MLKYLLTPLAFLLFAATASAQEVPWQVDPNHSDIVFVARHLGFAKVRGEFKKYTATAKADAKTGKLVALEAEADAKSIDTGNEKRDTHLRSDDFFGAEKYPTLKLKLKSIQWKGKAFTATVALTIRDVTKDVKFTGTLEGPQTINFGQGPHQRAAYHATAEINRKEFNLNFSGVAEGVALVSDKVSIEFDAELSAAPAVAEQAKPAAAPAKP